MTFRVRSNGAAIAVLELVHPGYFSALPPSPWEIACRAEHAGIATRAEVIFTEMIIRGHAPMRYL